MIDAESHLVCRATQGLLSLLRQLHDDLDRAVFAAYGWDDLATVLVGLPGATTPQRDKSDAQKQAEGELLMRLVDLNTQRAAEEAKGNIRWLRPEFQNPSAQVSTQHTQEEVEFEDTETVAVKAQAKAAWPKVMREQIAAVRQTLSSGPMSAQDIAERFKRCPILPVQSVLDSLVDVGIVQENNGMYRTTA